MRFLAPSAFALTALVGPLVALYMLKSRRTRMVVPSIVLWERAGLSVSSALPWQRLKITPLLILQLIVLSLFVAALARPFLSEQSLLGPHTVLVVDTSGSMAMSNRWELLQDRALGLVADASPAQIVSIVEGGPNPRVVTAFSSDPEVLARAMESLTPGGGVERLDEAIRLARGLETPDRPTKLIVLSDGGPTGTPLESEPIINAEHIAFTAFEPNIGIAAFSTEPSAEGATRLFLETANWDEAAAAREVEISVNDLVVAAVTMDMPPLGRARQTIPVEAGPGDMVTARLLGAPDGLELDDTATISVGRPHSSSVTVLGEGSIFLTSLIDASPFEVAEGDGADLLVVDGGPLPEIDRPAWIIATDEVPGGMNQIGTVQNVAVSFQQPGEPMLDQVDLSQVAVAEAQLVETMEWFPLVRAGDVPLVLLGQVNGQRVVYFTFDITHSNLPLQVAFPVLGIRILEFLAGGGAIVVEPELAGTPIVVSPPPGSTARVTTPSGVTRDLPAGTTLFRETNEVGGYLIEYTDEDGDPIASDVALRKFAPNESAGDFHELATVAPSATDEFTGQLVREWAPWFLGALLVFLGIEWWVGHRRPIRARRATVTVQ